MMVKVKSRYLLQYSRYGYYLSQSINRTKKHLKAINLLSSARLLHLFNNFHRGRVGEVWSVSFNLARISASHRHHRL